jgi:thiosulfate/3-mercaptopyruvate sulfurtransferase
MYGRLGLEKDAPVIAFCHGGYRSANAYIALRLAGYQVVRNYVSAWGEWGNRDDVPHLIPE